MLMGDIKEATKRTATINGSLLSGIAEFNYVRFGSTLNCRLWTGSVWQWRRREFGSNNKKLRYQITEEN